MSPVVLKSFFESNIVVLSLNKYQELCIVQKSCSSRGPAHHCLVSSSATKWSDRLLAICEISFWETNSFYLAQGPQSFPSPSMRLLGKLHFRVNQLSHQSYSQKKEQTYLLEYLHYLLDGYRERVCVKDKSEGLQGMTIKTVNLNPQ